MEATDSQRQAIKALCRRWIEETAYRDSRPVGQALYKATIDYFSGAAAMAGILGNTDLRGAIHWWVATRLKIVGYRAVENMASE